MRLCESVCYITYRTTHTMSQHSQTTRNTTMHFIWRKHTQIRISKWLQWYDKLTKLLSRPSILQYLHKPTRSTSLCKSQILIPCSKRERFVYILQSIKILPPTYNTKTFYYTYISITILWMKMKSTKIRDRHCGEHRCLGRSLHVDNGGAHRVRDCPSHVLCTRSCKLFSAYYSHHNAAAMRPTEYDGSNLTVDQLLVHLHM